MKKIVVITVSIVTLIVLLVIVVCTAIYFRYVIPTDLIIQGANDIFSGKKFAEDSHPFKRYNTLKHYENVDKIEYSLLRLYTWNNGQTGCIKVLYSIRYWDKDGNLLYASVNIPSTWYIKKENGKWDVYDIYEHP